MTDPLPSKTQRKKQMHELQDLGAELLRLNEQQLASLDLPESLRDAVVEAQRMTAFEARRRQLQYIGKLMRSIDAAPLRSRIDAYQAVARADTARFHRAELWRTRLTEDEGALTAFLAEHPRADAARLRALVRNVLRERESGRPPRSFRALFKLIDDILDPGEENRESR